MHKISFSEIKINTVTVLNSLFLSFKINMNLLSPLEDLFKEIFN